MKNLAENLRKYFENTPQDQVLADWAKTEKYDNVGPTVEAFFQANPKLYLIWTQDMVTLTFP